MKRFQFVLSAVALVTSAAHADSIDTKALTIAEIKTERISESAQDSLRALERFEVDLSRAGRPTPFNDDLDEATVVFDKIVNLGQKIWALVEKGRPVVNVNFQAATALPQGIAGWQQMEGWEAPKTALYRVSAKNLYGVTVIDFTYRVLYIAGGSYQGKGKYLARVAVQPQNLDVAWGYNFEANAEVPSVMNTGTVESPVGGAEVYVRWTIKTVLKENRGSGSYFVTGAGEFRNSDK